MKRIQIAQHASLAPLVFLFILASAVVIHITIPLPLIIPTQWSSLLGALFLVLGPALLERSHKTRAISPGPQKDPGFVGSGIYAYSRHPQYVGYVMMMAGLAFVMNSLVMLLAPVLAVVFFTFVMIPYQERLLQEQFPDIYPEYKKKVPMWI